MNKDTKKEKRNWKESKRRKQIRIRPQNVQWHHLASVSTGNQKKVTGHRRREMEREWGESKRNNWLKASQSQSIMRDTAKWPKGGVVTPLESPLFNSIRRFVFLLVSRSTTTHFSLCFLCFYFDVLLQFVRPANAFDTGNYLHAVRGSNKLINAYMPSAQQSGPQRLKTRRPCVDWRRSTAERS